MPFIRSIGKWTLTALVINAIIGSGIFGLPSELTRLLGRASPLAMLVAALAMATMILCMAEVASQFSDAGGPYLRGKRNKAHPRVRLAMVSGWRTLVSRNRTPAVEF